MFSWIVLVLIFTSTISHGKAFREFRNLGQGFGSPGAFGREAFNSLQAVGPSLFTPVTSNQRLGFSRSGSSGSSQGLVGRTISSIQGGKSPLFTSAGGQNMNIPQKNNQGRAFEGINSFQGATFPLTSSGGQGIGMNQGSAFRRVRGGSGPFEFREGNGLLSVRNQGSNFEGSRGVSGSSGSLSSGGLSSIGSQGMNQGGMTEGVGQGSSVAGGFSGQASLMPNSKLFPRSGSSGAFSDRFRRSDPSPLDHLHTSVRNVNTRKLKGGRYTNLPKYKLDIIDDLVQVTSL